MLLKRLSLTSDVDEVTRMNRWLDDAFVEAGTAAPVADDLKLCLNEAVANAMLYGFRDTVAPEIDIEIGLGRASASAVLTDNGKPFNPLDWPQRPKLTRLEDATIGGFGIQLIRQTATSVDYDRIDGRNRLSVICGAQD